MTDGLRQVLRLSQVLSLTLAVVAPAASVFTFVPILVARSGTGAIHSLLIAAIISLPVALVYAELSSAYPSAGGEYVIIRHILGRRFGFLFLGLAVVTTIFVVALFALSAATYIIPNASLMQLYIVSFTVIFVISIIGTINIKRNSILVAVVLSIEGLILSFITAIGFIQASKQSLTNVVVSPATLNENGTLGSTTVTSIILTSAISLSVYAGFGSGVYFSEETFTARRILPKIVLLTLGIAALSEILPVVALLSAMADIHAFLQEKNVFFGFLVAKLGTEANEFFNLGVALAIVNADLAILLMGARLMFCTGRDRVWHTIVNDALSRIHPKFQSPWIATCICGSLAVVALIIGLDRLVTITSTSLVATYAAMCVCALATRHRSLRKALDYQMPWYPVPPILGLLALLYILYVNWMLDTNSVVATLLIFAASGCYYHAVGLDESWYRFRRP
jgi:amino acid transporter